MYRGYEMSEFIVMDVQFNDEECLVGALKEVGFVPEVHNEAVELNNSYSSNLPKAHVVVRKGQFGGFADAGFERNKQGGFNLHCDNYDYAPGTIKDKLKMSRIKQFYAANIIKKQVRKTSKYSFISQQEDEGNIKIRIRRLG